MTGFKDGSVCVFFRSEKVLKGAKRSEKVGKGEAGLGHSVRVSPAFMIVLDIRILSNHWDEF